MMINQTTTLTCKFKDTLGTKKSITIDHLSEDITTDQMNQFMQATIESNVLILNKKNPETSLATTK